jgi:hypothetical protein
VGERVRPVPPAGLDERGRAFWLDVMAVYELSRSEVQILTEACRTLDNLDRLAEAIAAHGAVVEGSQGQPVINAALTEARGHRVVLHRLLAALALPDEEGEQLPSVESLRARRAAVARWQPHRREVAARVALGVE